MGYSAMIVTVREVDRFSFLLVCHQEKQIFTTRLLRVVCRVVHPTVLTYGTMFVVSGVVAGVIVPSVWQFR